VAAEVVANVAAEVAAAAADKLTVQTATAKS
jgi:hypothetical protein